MAGNRLAGLDGLRGVAALAVVAYHYDETHAYYGLLGVELFFVISGFVILMTLENVNTVGEFAVHRFARLYPAYWLSVAVAGGFLLLTHQTSLGMVAINATMLQGLINQREIIDPYWSLAYELWFYVMMAALFATGQLKWIQHLAIFWLVVMLAWHVTMYFGRGIPLFWNLAVRHYALPQFGHLFIAGMMIYRIRTDRWTATTAIVLIFTVAYSAFGRPDWAHVPPLIYFGANAAFITSVWIATSKSGAPFAFPPLVWIGQRSYSIYLLFMPAQLIAFYVLGSGAIGITGGLILTLISASLSWRYVERPFQIRAHMRRRALVNVGAVGNHR